MAGLLADKAVIVTGAGSGVGRAAAALFAGHGAKVVASDVAAPALENVVAEIRRDDGQAVAQVCDVTDAAAVAALVAAAVAAYGRLDVMFNNAGVMFNPPLGQPPCRLTDTPEDEAALMQAVNINGVLFGCRAAVRQFEHQGGGGVIVNTASVAGLIGYAGVVYGATKGAVTALTRTLAMEVAAQGIRVNSVCPGAMPTAMGGMDKLDLEDEAIHAAMCQVHPLGKIIQPIDAANAALFLASDLAANITGVNLAVDGGLTAGLPRRN